jgi:hypothetical protein
MALPISFIGQEIADNTLRANGSPTTTHWRLPMTTLTAGNFTAQIAKTAALLEAVVGIIGGQVQKGTTTAAVDIVSSSPASSPLAQRENKWLCRYHGTTLNQKFTVSIGTADLSLLAGHSEFLDLTADPGLAFKTAFEALVVSPDDDAEAVVLDTVQFVGRNT